MNLDHEFKNLVIESCDPGITIIKISRPQALNALNTEVLRELKKALHFESKNHNTRLIMLTGAGDKSFIAGADISEMKDKSIAEATEFAQLGHEVAQLLELMAKPTLAVVNGYALGGGTEMAIACDFIIASDRAVFGQPEVGLGIIPGFGGTIRLAKFVGLPRAKELIFSGRRIQADEALSIGLVNHVFPASDLMKEAIQIATSICNQSIHAVVRTKKLLNEFSESTGLNSKLDAEVQSFGRLFGTPDQREGMNAFIEKRKPIFDGLVKTKRNKQHD